MGKGEEKRKLILQRAFKESVNVGMEGLTIGALATALKMSKSGVHGLFGNKKELQLQVIDYAVEQFMCKVIQPAFALPNGERRIRLLFQNWLALCGARFDDVEEFFASTAAEYDDRPGAVRDKLLAQQSRWMAFIATTFRDGIQAGEFREDFDPDQFAFEMYGIILGHHHAARMLGDSKAEKRAKEAFDRLIDAARANKSPS